MSSRTYASRERNIGRQLPAHKHKDQRTSGPGTNIPKGRQRTRRGEPHLSLREALHGRQRVYETLATYLGLSDARLEGRAEKQVDCSRARESHGRRQQEARRVRILWDTAWMLHIWELPRSKARLGSLIARLPPIERRPIPQGTSPIKRATNLLAVQSSQLNQMIIYDRFPHTLREY